MLTKGLLALPLDLNLPESRIELARLGELATKLAMLVKQTRSVLMLRDE